MIVWSKDDLSWGNTEDFAWDQRAINYLHHYCKHGEDPHKLECPERCFQPEDVCVCCDCSRPWHRRCSHEMWIVLFAALFVWCYWELKDCD